MGKTGDGDNKRSVGNLSSPSTVAHERYGVRECFTHSSTALSTGKYLL